MHYAFDKWMDREHPDCHFERYADDIVAHCGAERQARDLRAAIAVRLGTLGLELHPQKTKIVYCQDANRRGTSEHVSFDFLGLGFPRLTGHRLMLLLGCPRTPRTPGAMRTRENCGAVHYCTT
jgi:hypothetical protein